MQCLTVHYLACAVQDEAAGFKDAAAVLARARAMAAQQLAVEPAVRAFVRSAIADIATVTTGAPITCAELQAYPALHSECAKGVSPLLEGLSFSCLPQPAHAAVLLLSIACRMFSRDAAGACCSRGTCRNAGAASTAARAALLTMPEPSMHNSLQCTQS
jgi:hypothetical protein